MFFLNQGDLAGLPQLFMNRTWRPYAQTFERIEGVLETLSWNLLSPYEVLAAAIWLSNGQMAIHERSVLYAHEQKVLMPLLRTSWSAFMQYSGCRHGEIAGKQPRFQARPDRLLKVRRIAADRNMDALVEATLLCNWGAFMFDPIRVFEYAGSDEDAVLRVKQLQSSLTCQIGHFCADIKEAMLMFEGGKEAALNWYFRQRYSDRNSTYWERTENLASALMEAHRDSTTPKEKNHQGPETQAVRG